MIMQFITKSRLVYQVVHSEYIWICEVIGVGGTLRHLSKDNQVSKSVKIWQNQYLLTVFLIAVISTVVSKVTHTSLGHTQILRAAELLSRTHCVTHWGQRHQRKGSKQPQKHRLTVCPLTTAHDLLLWGKHVVLKIEEAASVEVQLVFNVYT